MPEIISRPRRGKGPLPGFHPGTDVVGNVRPEKGLVRSPAHSLDHQVQSRGCHRQNLLQKGFPLGSRSLDPHHVHSGHADQVGIQAGHAVLSELAEEMVTVPGGTHIPSVGMARPPGHPHGPLKLLFMFFQHTGNFQDCPIGRTVVKGPLVPGVIMAGQQEEFLRLSPDLCHRKGYLPDPAVHLDRQLRHYRPGRTLQPLYQPAAGVQGHPHHRHVQQQKPAVQIRGSPHGPCRILMDQGFPASPHLNPACCPVGLQKLPVTLVKAISHHDFSPDRLPEPLLLKLRGLRPFRGPVKDQLCLQTVTASGKGPGAGPVKYPVHLKSAFHRIGQIGREGQDPAVNPRRLHFPLYVPDRPEGIRLPGQLLIPAQFLQMPPYGQAVNFLCPFLITTNIHIPVLLNIRLPGLPA